MSKYVISPVNPPKFPSDSPWISILRANFMDWTQLTRMNWPQNIGNTDKTLVLALILW